MTTTMEFMGVLMLGVDTSGFRIPLPHTNFSIPSPQTGSVKRTWDPGAAVTFDAPQSCCGRKQDPSRDPGLRRRLSTRRASDAQNVLTGMTKSRITDRYGQETRMSLQVG